MSSICTCAPAPPPPILRTATYRPVQLPKPTGRSTSAPDSPVPGTTARGSPSQIFPRTRNAQARNRQSRPVPLQNCRARRGEVSLGCSCRRACSCSVWRRGLDRCRQSGGVSGSDGGKDTQTGRIDWQRTDLSGTGHPPGLASCPVPRTFLLSLNLARPASSAPYCNFPRFAASSAAVRPDAGWGPTGEAGWASARAISSAQATPGHCLKRAKRAPWPPWIVDEDSSVQVRELHRAIAGITRI
jgi:hypothetical protein